MPLFYIQVIKQQSVFQKAWCELNALKGMISEGIEAIFLLAISKHPLRVKKDKKIRLILCSTVGEL